MNLSKKSKAKPQKEFNQLLEEFKFPVTLLSGKNFHAMFLLGMGEEGYAGFKKELNSLAGFCYAKHPLPYWPDYLNKNHIAALNFDCIKRMAQHHSRKGSSFSVIDLCKIQVLIVASHEMGHIQYEKHCTDLSCLFNGDNNGFSI